MSEGNPNSKMESPAEGNLPNDHPLNGSRYSVTEAAITTMNGVGHESLSEVNSTAKSPVDRHGADVPASAGSIIGLPGVTLAIDDGPPYASRFELANKEHQLPKGIQLMFSVR